MKPKNLSIFAAVVIVLAILSSTKKVYAFSEDCQRWLHLLFPIYCTSNKDCPDNLSCIVEEKKCANPCNSSSCKFKDEICSITSHEIHCKSGAESCTERKDCPDYLDCLEEKCRSPCDEKKCGKDEKCVVQEHSAKCKANAVAACPWWDIFCHAGFYHYYSSEK